MLTVNKISKSFTLHLADAEPRTVLRDVSFTVGAGECVVLGGPSGIGKSSILKMVFGTYAADGGSVRVACNGHTVDVVSAHPREVAALRRAAMGYVSQFLRVIPRVAAIDVVAEPILAAGRPRDEATARAATLLARLNVPDRLWRLPPATFSGGEKQRINIARGFAVPRPLFLLDEPTASLDAENTEAVVELILEAKAGGSALLGIFHDAAVRERVADRTVDVSAFQPLS